MLVVVVTADLPAKRTGLKGRRALVPAVIADEPLTGILRRMMLAAVEVGNGSPVDGITGRGLARSVVVETLDSDEGGERITYSNQEKFNNQSHWRIKRIRPIEATISSYLFDACSTVDNCLA